MRKSRQGDSELMIRIRQKNLLDIPSLLDQINYINSIGENALIYCIY